ncbi:hypothetical protein LPL18_011465 [Halomonas sp. CUBES01]|uniref:hypothetical protein n=1 Tax=Halomonas sp. CUBES01 TaxID=2897340 RepID=UPI001E5B81BA|nr:hypothetical protein [Halomonas sp. CUBES01]MEC4767943.1 hypothetical protein [Halomonas sp. CUBES01]
MKNSLVGVLMAVAASIFVAAYVLKFGSLNTSNDPGDWADFATYLSGTVGVSAVVATLIVLVRTLCQQQELLNSQEKMLNKQAEQISLAENQIKDEEVRRKVELAYSNTVTMFPYMFESFIKYLDKGIFPYADEDGFAKELVSEFGTYSPTAREVILNPDFVFRMVSEEPGEIIESYIARVFARVEVVFEYVTKCLKVDEGMKDYFSIYLDLEDDKNIDNEDYDFYFRCYQALLIGLEDRESVCKGSKYLDLSDDFSSANNEFSKWQKVGEAIERRIEDTQINLI